jgi:ATP-dependent Clp protease ATP-binding subunit ClpC
MAPVPSSKNRRRIEIPARQYDRLKEIADTEERTVTGVLVELVNTGLRNYQPAWVPSEHRDQLSPRATHVVELAQNEEPRQFNHNYAGTEHLLLGLLDEGGGIAAKVLRDFGVEITTVQRAVEAIIGHGDEPSRGRMEFSPRARKVLGLAADEARKLDHNVIGTGHLLLGLVRDEEGIGALILKHPKGANVNLEELRTAVLRALARGDVPLLDT